MDQLRCTGCGRIYTLDPRMWRCACGSPLDLQFKPVIIKDQIRKRPPTLWRYREVLPIEEEEHFLSLGEGMTPLVPLEYHGCSVLIKVDYLYPTGSYKDRGAAVLISKAKEMGVDAVVEDSSGNAGCAIAAYCARGKIACEIFVPESTSKGKLEQIRSYGATLRRVEGTREMTAEATRKAASATYYASHCWNPYFLHGTKTFAYEVWEQLRWRAPDTVVLPVGHGTLLLGAYLGFKELKEAGLIQTVPRLIGVQAVSCAPLYQAFERGTEEVPPLGDTETLAEGIAISNPVRGRQILQALRETGGLVLAVREEEIGDALKEMGRNGFFIEPTSAATMAGLKQYLLHKTPKETVVASLTGTGLKSVGKMV